VSRETPNNKTASETDMKGRLLGIFAINSCLTASFRSAFFLALSALCPHSFEQKLVITVFASNDFPQ
jgi:hypothetical protein